MSIYRKIYEQFNGSIPLDNNGKTYDIHHIDGNHKNNILSNLIALSIQDHFDVHFKQGDYRACSAIALRLNKTKEEISNLNKLAADKRVKDGKCNFNSEFAKKIQKKLVEEGKHHMLGDGSFQRNIQKKLIAEGNHNTLESVTCPHCNKSGQSVAMKRWHFDNCKELK